MNRNRFLKTCRDVGHIVKFSACIYGKIKNKIMTSIINRIIELAGWIVLGVSVILLGVASHIDNYQPPEPVTVAQPK